jgi:hypothetical protein
VPAFRAVLPAERSHHVLNKRGEHRCLPTYQQQDDPR